MASKRLRNRKDKRNTSAPTINISVALQKNVTLSVVEESPGKVHFDYNNVIAKGNIVMIFVCFCPLIRHCVTPSPRGRRLS